MSATASGRQPARRASNGSNLCRAKTLPLLILALITVAIITACTSSEPGPTAEPSSTPLPTATAFNSAPTSTPAPRATIDPANIPQDIIDGFGISIVPFMEELQEQGRRSSLFSACQPLEPDSVPGAQFVSQLAMDINSDLEALLDRGMGGAEIACMVEKQSTLGGTQITLIYDITNPGWIATERQLRDVLDGAGIPDLLIEGSYVEFDFFPSGSFRIPTLIGLGYPGELQMEMAFLTSDVVVNISDPNAVCGADGDSVPPGTGDVGDVTEALATDLEAALGIALTTSCVTWRELGDVTSLDIQFSSDSPPTDNPIPGLDQLLDTYGASDINSGGSRLRGGAAFTDGEIGGHNVTGVINLNGNEAFNNPDTGPVAAFMAVTATLQITN